MEKGSVLSSLCIWKSRYLWRVMIVCPSSELNEDLCDTECMNATRSWMEGVLQVKELQVRNRAA